MLLFHGLVKFLSSGFYSGFFPKAPGTFGTIFGLLFFLVFKFFFPDPFHIFYLSFLLFFTFLGFYLCDFAEKKIFQVTDPKEVVWDEWIGIGVSIVSLPFPRTGMQFFFYFLAFLLFRFFDIVKPMPIYQIQKFPGGFGIMLDDILAGIFTLVLLIFLSFLLGNSF